MKKLMLVCIAAALVAACGQKQETKSATATQLVQPTTTVAPSTQAAAVPQSAEPVQSPHGTAVPQASPEKVSGTVAETLDSAGFTYVRLTTDQGDKWVVVRQMPLKKGAKITVITNMVADKFESKSLKKTFDKLIFGELEGAAPAPMASAAGAAQNAAPSAATGMISPHGSQAAASGAGADSAVPPAMAAMMKAQHSGMSAGPVDDAPIKVAKAEGAGAKTVAEIWASRATTREGEPVVVRGKVVKFLSGIMGKNWVHLRDGSGSHEKGDNDITITTNDTVAVGNVVVVSGVLHLNKDFGAGYSYPVIIEEAKIK